MDARARALLVSSLLLVPTAFAIPFLPYANVLGLVALPASALVAALSATALYVLAVEVAECWF